MKRIAMVAAVLAAAVTACGGGSGGTGGPAGVDRSRLVSAVTDDDKAALCDWFAPMVGGYGATHSCQDAYLTAPPDKATCVAEFPPCTGSVTVGQFEDCVVAIVAAQDQCSTTALVQVQTRADCQAVAAGGCFD
jgi:hypothetical protein